jgi:membrane protein implicated in regulation of membrane protease activity
MLEVLFSSGALNIVYTLVFAISFIFALISLVGAELGDILDFDFGGEGEGSFDFVSISPFSLAMFGAVFGLVGLITRIWLEMEPIPSILWAAGSGILIGIAAQAFFLYVLSPSKSSHYSLEEDAIGRDAEVVITIPSEGMGQITFNNVSGRVTLGARSAAGQPIRSGEVVVIEKIVGRVALVRPTSEES